MLNPETGEKNAAGIGIGATDSDKKLEEWWKTDSKRWIWTM
jgi:hypothetical protein